MVNVRKSWFLALVAVAFLVPLILVATASADSHNPSRQIAGDYTVVSNTPSGPPVVENGVTTISVIAEAALRGSNEGTAAVTVDCVLGTDGASNVCEGTMDFEGSLRGRIGTLKATVDSWISGGDDAFTSAKFTLVSGSGTGDLSNLVELNLTIQRDETVEYPDGVQPVGIYFGTLQFDGDESASSITQIVGDYTVVSNTPSGPPVVENGVTMISVIAEAALRGSNEGTAAVTVDCILGKDGAPNVCEGTMDFEGSLRGRIGTLKATVDSWISGGDDAFTSAKFTLVSGSGTGDLSNLVELNLTIQRDETVEYPDGVQPVGALFRNATV